MKQYYYITGKARIGPLTEAQLKSEPIDNDTLIWFEGLDQWKPLKEISELQSAFKIPPPIPTNTLRIIKPTIRQTGFYLLWVVILIILFLLTKSDNDFLQERRPKTSKLWPFTADFYSEKSSHTGFYGCQTLNGEPCFYGILADFDLSEVIIYSLIPVIFFLLRGLLTKNK